MLKKRVHAFTIDMFVIVLANYTLMTSFTQFVKTVFFHFPFKAQMFLVSKINMINSVTLMSIMFSYFSIFYFVTNGKTFGKMVIGLKVQSSNGEMTLIEAMKRSLAYFVCAMSGSLLYVIPFMRKDQRSLADMFSHTTVVLEHAETPTELESIEESKAA